MNGHQPAHRSDSCCSVLIFSYSLRKQNTASGRIFLVNTVNNNFIFNRKSWSRRSSVSNIFHIERFKKGNWVGCESCIPKACRIFLHYLTFVIFLFDLALKSKEYPTKKELGENGGLRDFRCSRFLGGVVWARGKRACIEIFYPFD